MCACVCMCGVCVCVYDIFILPSISRLIFKLFLFEGYCEQIDKNMDVWVHISVAEYRILKTWHTRKNQADKNTEALVLLASFIVLGFSIILRRKLLLSIVQFNQQSYSNWTPWAMIMTGLQDMATGTIMIWMLWA